APSGWVLPGRTPQRLQDLVVAPHPAPLRGGGLTDGSGPVKGPATVVLPVPAGRGWSAWVGGTRLEPSTVRGWEQGFGVPQGGGGPLQVRETGESRRRTLLLIEGLLVLAVVATLFR